MREAMNHQCTRAMLCVLGFLFAGCAAHIPPQNIVETGALLQSAFAAEAPAFAPGEYARAQESLFVSKMEMDMHRYKKAQVLLESAKRDAEIALLKAQAAKTIKQAQDQLYGADLGQLNKYITDVCALAEKSLKRAQSEFASKNYRLAKRNAHLSFQLSQELPRLLEEKKLQKQNIGISTTEMEKISFQAQKLLENTQLQAANIIADARRKADAVIARALEKRYPSSYTVKSGNKLQIIAARREIFNGMYQWLLIYKASRDQIRDPQILFVGEQMIIPRKPPIEEVTRGTKTGRSSGTV